MTEQVQDPTEPLEEPQGGTGQEDTFPRSYVEELRTENASLRLKGKEVNSLKEALQTAYLREGTRGILHDPESLAWSEDFTESETGLPDIEKIQNAAEALAADKPWLSRPRGDAGQGFRGEESDAVSLADLLRIGA